MLKQNLSEHVSSDSVCFIYSTCSTVQQLPHYFNITSTYSYQLYGGYFVNVLQTKVVLLWPTGSTSKSHFTYSSQSTKRVLLVRQLM